MRCDLAAVLLHDPPILYLDEPTIGLDIVAKLKIRSFLKDINSERKTTIILTTHDLSDVEKLCDRMMIIDHGKIIYNGTVNEIKKIHGKKRRFIVGIAGNFDEINIPNTEIIRRKDQKLWIQFDGSQITASQLISVITQRYEVIDLTIDEPEIETIVSKIYEEGI